MVELSPAGSDGMPPPTCAPGMGSSTFVTDAYTRRILDWSVATSMSTQLVLNAIEQNIWTRARGRRGALTVLVHHPDRLNPPGSASEFSRGVGAGRPRDGDVFIRRRGRGARGRVVRRAPCPRRPRPG